MRLLLVLLLLSLNMTVYSRILEKGDACTKSKGGKGICTHFLDCQTAIQEVGANGRPEICSFDGRFPIVCCQKDKVTEGSVSKSAMLVANKTNSFRYIPFDENNKRLRKCRDFHSERTIIPPNAFIGGVNAVPRQFPHMARLGYGESNNIQWQCGGSLISQEFVLTAAHCLNSRLYGELRYIRLGELEVDSSNDKPQDFTVRETHQHPNFTPISTYHDIALVRLDRPATLNEYVKPACLPIIRNLSRGVHSAIAMGWGLTSVGGSPAKILQYGYLRFVSNEMCRKTYGTSIRFKEGIIDDWQICADGGGEAKDTCQGDSGGPLEITNYGYEFNTFPEILGITSFGKECALVAGVYARVYTYVPWIEEIVWPNE